MTRKLQWRLTYIILFAAALAAMMNTARASVTVQQILDNQIYAGEGFSLLIPSSWTTFTASKSEVEYAGIGTVPVYEFGLGEQPVMFSISKFTQEQWSSVLAQADGPVPTLLKETADNVFAYDVSQTFADAVTEQSKDIDWIIANVIINTDQLSDIEGNKNNDAIQFLYNHKVISGYPDGTYKPEQTINRAELMKILVIGAGGTPDVSEFHDCFPDVTDEWFAPYVCYAKTKNWVQGYPDGNFLPAQNVNKVEAVKMLINARSYLIPGSVTVTGFDDVDTSAWYAPFMKTAEDKGLLEETSGVYGVGEDITRGEISENLYRALLLARYDSMDTTPTTNGTDTTGQTQETSETQATTEGYDIFTSDSYKFSIEYPKNYYYSAVETTNQSVIRRYEFGSNPIEEQPGEIALELQSAAPPIGVSVTTYPGKTLIKVTDAIMANVYYETDKRVYHLVGEAALEETLLNMASTIQEL